MSTTSTSRRSVLQLALASALTPALLSRIVLAAEPPHRLIAPPPGRMTFRRVLMRTMAGGERIVVRREFAVEFTRFAGGFWVEGAQTAAEVEAPEALRGFAELERARAESELFPLALDPFGHILSDDRVTPPGGEIDRAMSLAMQAIADQPIASDERAELKLFLQAISLTGQSLIAHLPLDLFAPGEVPRREERIIELPTGEAGRVLTSFLGERDSTTALMREATREVVTEVDGTTRSSHERWELGPASG